MLLFVSEANIMQWFILYLCTKHNCVLETAAQGWKGTADSPVQKAAAITKGSWGPEGFKVGSYQSVWFRGRPFWCHGYWKEKQQVA